MRTLPLHPQYFQQVRKSHLGVYTPISFRKETPMTRKSSKSHNSHDLSRCRRLSPSARRCRLSVGSESRFYCRNHAHLQPPVGEVVDLSAELMADVNKFTSASDINKFLSKILLLLSQDRISPRRA